MKKKTVRIDDIIADVAANDRTPGTHTPGPWSVSLINERGWGFGPDPKTVAVFYCINDQGNGGERHEILMGEAEANARLIAAAPDLLAALKKSQALILAIEQATGVSYTDYIADNRAAILRATEGK